MKEAAHAHLLEGDGVITNLFYFLWKRIASDAVASHGSHPNPALDLSFPSTVVFEHNYPKAWYTHALGRRVWCSSHTP